MYINFVFLKIISWLSEQELKVLIEEEIETLRFFVLYEEEFKKYESDKDWEMAINECLDILIDYYRLLNNSDIFH